MSVLNGACVLLAIACCAAGCTSTPPASGQVRVTLAPSDVEGCTLLGKVIVSDTAPEKEARDEVARLGGNVLLRKSELVWNGNAYHCPAAAH